jgi:hypothetical protein
MDAASPTGLILRELSQLREDTKERFDKQDVQLGRIESRVGALETKETARAARWAWHTSPVFAALSGSVLSGAVYVALAVFHA